MRVIEVGHVVYSPALQRTPLGTEAQYLLGALRLRDLRYRRYEWKCDALNAASRARRAALGFAFEGILRQHMIAKGRNRDTAWFRDAGRRLAGAQGKFRTLAGTENFDDRRQADSRA